jgi:hypothetical protein
MRRVTAMLSTAAVLLWATAAFAQAPNFAGKWAPDAEKNPAPAANAGGGGGGGGRGGGRGAAGPMTITQDAKTLTIERDMGGNAVKTVYNLDGSPSKNMMAGRGGQTEQESSAKWDGAKLVITTKGANGDQVTSWYMDGADLVNERTTQNGAMKTYYKKG